MTEQDQRIAITEACGFTGCSDSDCDYRRCQHLHKDGRVYFPETYSRPMYPDYLHDNNAMHEAEKVLNQQGKWLDYSHALACVVDPEGNNEYQTTLQWITVWPILHATAAQRAEAFLRTIGKWVES